MTWLRMTREWGQGNEEYQVTLLRIEVEVCVATGLGPPWVNESRQLSQAQMHTAGFVRGECY